MLEVDTQSPPLLETRDAKLWGKKCSRWLLCSSVVGVQVARHLVLLAEQSLQRVARPGFHLGAQRLCSHSPARALH